MRARSCLCACMIQRKEYRTATQHMLALPVNKLSLCRFGVVVFWCVFFVVVFGGGVRVMNCLPSGESSSGELSSGELSSGELLTGESSTVVFVFGGELPGGESSTGELSSGLLSSGDSSSGEWSSGELSSVKLSTGESSSRESSSGELSNGKSYSGDSSSGELSSAEIVLRPHQWPTLRRQTTRDVNYGSHCLRSGRAGGFPVT